MSIKLNSTQAISAMDFIMSFDPSVFDFVSAAAEAGLTIWGTREGTGTVELILASDGAGNAVNGDKQVLSLTFRVAGFSNTSNLSLTKADISDTSENIISAELSAKTIAMLSNQNLNDLISIVEGTLVTAVEGIGIGQYPYGSKERLEVLLNDAKAVRDNNNATQVQLDAASMRLTEAYEFFLSLKITASTGDFNKNLPGGQIGIDIGDLGVVARYYGVKIGDEAWVDAAKYDINGDGYIGIYEMAFIALKMLSK